MKTSEPLSSSNPRAIVAALLVAVGLLLSSAAVFVHPLATSNGLGGQVALAGDHPSEILLFCVLYLVSSVVLVPGLVLLAGITRGRGAWFTFAAVSVILIGSLGNAGESAFKIAFVAVAPNPDRGQLVAALSDLNAYIGPFLVLAAIFDVGLLLLCGAMWRARLVPAWPLLVTLAGDVVGSVGIGGKPGYDASLLVGIVGLLWVCVGIARAPRADLAYEPLVPSPDPYAPAIV